MHIFESEGTVVGFGLDETDEPSKKLQEATLPVLNRDNCLKYDPKTYGSRLKSGMYCAGGKDNISACNGDSGGGMFFEIDKTWYLRGIVSFSPIRPNTARPLCDPSKPTVFTDVSKYTKWILRYTNTTKWLKELPTCVNSTIEKDTECNAGGRFDHDFLIVGMKDRIIRAPMNGDPAFNVHEVEKLEGLDYDCVGGRFYWTEAGTAAIFSAKYDGTDKKNFINMDVKNPTHIAVDWVSRRLYWVDSGKKTLEVASLENPSLRTTVRVLMAETRRIAVDPLQRKLYRISKSHGIMSYNLDGSEQEPLLYATELEDMKVSMATGEICYIDDSNSKIECLDTRSKLTRTIVSNVTDPLSLAVTDELFYWTTENRLVIL
ncbi:hypothetical protein ZHAS_00019969 [Anopheles sinensis]|uniref:Peptidase S1 domain-containing protein n=1 Tax=Anopheles sinensis TaxID=74873 RepID=A0A084WNL4_ANOSI|nr:hypothetical protein ZHAS_00019969 [Anopheles sinensis]